jgi:hypothetical protein
MKIVGIILAAIMFILICIFAANKNDETKYSIAVFNAYLAIVIVWMVKAMMLLK